MKSKHALLSKRSYWTTGPSLNLMVRFRGLLLILKSVETNEGKKVYISCKQSNQ